MSRSSTGPLPDSAPTRGARRSTRPAATSCPASSTRTSTSSRPSSCSTSSRGSCCRSGRRRSWPTRTRSRTFSAPTASTGSSTPLPPCRSRCTSWRPRAFRPHGSSRPGDELTTGDLEGLLRRRRMLGLAEMMNFPGVVASSEPELAKLALASHVDGHAPGLAGKPLNAYAAAGIRSDHEAATADEGRERLRAGMWLLIREASGARNLRGAASARARVRSAPDRVLHRRSRARAHRRGRAHQRDRA